jgi:Fic family protein
MLENYYSKALQGLAVIGTSDFEIVPFILLGHYDHVLKCAAWSTKNTTPPATEADLDTPEIVELVERIKQSFRKVVEDLFRGAALDDEQQARQERRERQNKARQELVALQNSMKATNKPHEMGTVAEIAEKYGISKSEVRRRKAEGTLHELTEQK